MVIKLILFPLILQYYYVTVGYCFHCYNNYSLLSMLLYVSLFLFVVFTDVMVVAVVIIIIVVVIVCCFH